LLPATNKNSREYAASSPIVKSETTFELDEIFSAAKILQNERPATIWITIAGAAFGPAPPIFISLSRMAEMRDHFITPIGTLTPTDAALPETARTPSFADHVRTKVSTIRFA
jgi:hypothetical protein